MSGESTRAHDTRHMASSTVDSPQIERQEARGKRRGARGIPVMGDG